MKNRKKTVMRLLAAAVLLIAVFMTGCARQLEVRDTTPPETTTPAESDGSGVYIKLEHDDAASVALHWGSFAKVCETADDSLPKSGEWLFTGNEIAQLAEEENRSILFTVRALAADDTLLVDGAFFYDVTQEKLYVTIAPDGVTCSTSDAPDAPADVMPVLTLPILYEIDASIATDASAFSLPVVQAAVELMDWGLNTGLDTIEIGDAASTWFTARNDGQSWSSVFRRGNL